MFKAARHSSHGPISTAFALEGNRKVNVFRSHATEQLRKDLKYPNRAKLFCKDNLLLVGLPNIHYLHMVTEESLDGPLACRGVSSAGFPLISFASGSSHMSYAF